MRTTTLFLIVVLTASSAQAISHYYQRKDGVKISPIRKTAETIHPWTEAGTFKNNRTYYHKLYPGVQLCQSPVGHGWDISSEDLPSANLSGADLAAQVLDLCFGQHRSFHRPA